MNRILKCLLIAALGLPSQLRAETVYDVSGADGVKDPDGYSYLPGDAAPRARDGSRGGDAQEVYEAQRLRKKGWDGGELHLTLSAPSEGKVNVQGYKVAPEARGQEQVLDSLPLNAKTSFKFRARGGRGGDGGHGGRGQDGGRGRPGLDATRLYAGTNGGPGGHGGDEGDSTDGGDAGQGGRIVIRVPIQDNDLAMLISETDVSGNEGGRAGHGQGVGQGGLGGPGGDAHIWTESKTVTKSRVVVDADGKPHTEYYTDTETETHMNPGGVRGRSGHEGRRSRKPVRDGRKSGHGKFVYEIVDEDGKTQRYDGVYNLSLLPNYQIHGSLNNPGFFEPGETLSVRNLTVINSGHAPTPKYQPLKLFLQDSFWIRSHPVELTLPRVLNPGETHTFSGQDLTFHLQERPVTRAGVLQGRETVGPKARVTRVEREFQNFNEGAQTEIQVQYPIRITPLSSLVTLAPGEAARVYFHVRNISTQTIGQMPGLDARKAHATLKRVGGDLQAEAFVLAPSLFDAKTDPKEGFSRALTGLRPGEEMLVEAVVGFTEDARHYSKVVLQPELYLESLLEPGQQNLIQFEPFTLRVCQTFKFTPGADILLIANHSLSEQALAALRATAAIKHLKMDIWDFSYYGFFNFSQAVENYESLFEAYRGKTLMILGNEVKTPVGGVRVPYLLSPDQVIEAARRYGIKIVILDTSADPKQTLADMAEPLPFHTSDPVREHASQREYLRELRRMIHEVQEDDGNPQAFLGVDRMQIRQLRLWGQPSESSLRTTAEKTLAQSDKLVPEGRLFIDYTYSPEQQGRKLYVFKQWQLGFLQVRRSVDDSKTSLVAFKISQDQLENPDFLLSPSFQSTFDSGLNFTTKLDLLNSVLLGEFTQTELPEEFKHLAVPQPETFAEVLVQTLLLDLLHEQVTLRAHGGGLLAKSDLWDKLDLLKKLTHYDYRQFQLNPASREGQMFVQLIAALRFYNQATLTLWDRLSPKRTFNHTLSALTDEMLQRLTLTVFPDVKAATEAIDQVVEDLQAESRKKKVSRPQLVEFLDQQNLRQKTLREASVERNLRSRVRSEAQQQTVLTRDQERRQRAREVSESVNGENERMKLAPQMHLDFLRP